MSFRSTLLLGLWLLAFTQVQARPLNASQGIPHLTTEATIDGVLDEAIWQQATHITLNTETSPGNNLPSEWTADAYIYEAGTALYVAINAYDPRPEEIRSQYRKRDSIDNDDYIGVVIDPFNDQRAGFEFYLSPLGVQADKLRDEAKNKSSKSWNAIWYGAGQQHAQGYTVEFEIPFSALRFPDTSKPQSWGIEFSRFIPRDSKMWVSSAAKERGNKCYLCQIPTYYGFQGIEAGSGFQVTPALVINNTQLREPANTATDRLPTWSERALAEELEPNLGLDARWGITQDNVLNLTLNPDFSQVESDATNTSVNSTFAPSFPERRAFFLEGSDYFKTARLSLLHTRKIAQPDYGLKFTGKTGGHNYAALVANDAATHLILPATQVSKAIELLDANEMPLESKNAVVRYQKNFGRQSNMGVFVSQRTAEGYRNTVGSIDSVIQFNKSHNLSYQLAFSDTLNPQSLLAEVADNDDYSLQAKQSDLAFNSQYTYNQPSYDLKARYERLGQDFRSDLGNIGKVGFEKYLLGGGYTWFGHNSSPWTKWGAFGDWDKTNDADGQMIEEEYEGTVWLDGPNQLYAKFAMASRDKYWKSVYYEQKEVNFYSRFDPVKSVRLWTRLKFGDAIDVKNEQASELTKVEFGTDLRLGPHITSSGKYLYQKMDVDEGKLFDISQYDFRFNLQFNLDSSIKLVYKRSDVTKDAALYHYHSVDEIDIKRTTQLIYSYVPNPKTSYFIGYADHAYQDDSLEKISVDERSLFMKLSYTFQA